MNHKKYYFLMIFHHHHVVSLARISLTLSRHFSLSFIVSGTSSGLHPISSHCCWMYVRAGRPAFAQPYVGVHRSTSLMIMIFSHTLLYNTQGNGKERETSKEKLNFFLTKEIKFLFWGFKMMASEPFIPKQKLMIYRKIEVSKWWHKNHLYQSKNWWFTEKLQV